MLRRRLLAAAAGLAFAGPALPQENDFDQAVREVLGGDPAAYRRVIAGFQAAVRDGDAEAAAALVSYPIGVSIGGRAVTIRTPQAFAAQFSAIVIPAIAAAIASEPTNAMMVNYQGVMLGRGEVWVGGVCLDAGCARSRVRVITIQPGP